MVTLSLRGFLRGLSSVLSYGDYGGWIGATTTTAVAAATTVTTTAEASAASSSSLAAVAAGVC